MITKLRSISIVLFAILFVFSSCKKEKYSFGDIKTPANLALSAVIVGVDVANPNGDGSGSVAISVTAENALSYNFDFGDGNTKVIQSGSIDYKYKTPGTNEYTITVNAVGTGGAVSTISKRIKVFVAFEIPADILAALTDGTSKTWITDKDAGGHFGVGPNDQFSPIWYSAGPNSREPCAYDDEITFSKDPLNRVSMTIDNKGQSFSIGAASVFYGFSGGDNCFGISTGGTRLLDFSAASSGSTPAVSTQIEFKVPGNGIINFGTGGTVYEILSITATNMHLRNIGIDGNSWYQKLIKKP